MEIGSGARPAWVDSAAAEMEAGRADKEKGNGKGKHKNKGKGKGKSKLEF